MHISFEDIFHVCLLISANIIYTTGFVNDWIFPLQGAISESL